MTRNISLGVPLKKDFTIKGCSMFSHSLYEALREQDMAAGSNYPANNIITTTRKRVCLAGTDADPAARDAPAMSVVVG